MNAASARELTFLPFLDGDGWMHTAVAIRRCLPRDAPQLLRLQRRLDRQSTSMLLEPDERETRPEALERRLDSQGDIGSFDVIAETAPGVDAGPALVGWLQVDVPRYRRIAHLGYVVLGVDSDHAGQGVGTALVQAATAMALDRGLRRLELTVLARNTRAVKLYQRHGFKTEGVRRSAFQLDGELLDELYMARLL